MNPVRKFDEVSRELRGRAWLQHTWVTSFNQKPWRTVISSIFFVSGSLGLIIIGYLALFSANQLLDWLTLFSAICAFCGVLWYARASASSLRSRYQLGKDVYLVDRYAKYQALKEKLGETLELEISIVDVLKAHVENLLSYPVGGVIFRHPLFTTFTSVTLSALVSILIKHPNRNNLKHSLV